MKSTMKIVFVILAIASVAVAADKPNFTGEWKINVANSNFGPYPTPTLLVMKVSHLEPTLTVTEEQTGGFGEPRSTRHYTTDGKAIAYQSNGAEITAAGTWKADAFVINARGVVATPVGETTFLFTDTWTLADEGRTLLQVIHVETPQGPLDMTRAFDKQ